MSLHEDSIWNELELAKERIAELETFFKQAVEENQKFCITIQAIAEENFRYREALEPFVSVAEMLIKLRSTDITLWSTNNNYEANVKVTADMVIKAYKALEEV